MEHWTRAEQLQEVHRAGGAVIQAHPFRIRNYMDLIRVCELFADGVEVANVGNDQLDDARAYLYAEQKGLLMTAGSDNHKSPPKAVFGIELDKRLESIDDYVRIILQRGKIGLHVPEERFVMPDVPIDERHKAYWLNEREEMLPLEKGPWS